MVTWRSRNKAPAVTCRVVCSKRKRSSRKRSSRKGRKRSSRRKSSGRKRSSRKGKKRSSRKRSSRKGRKRSSRRRRSASSGTRMSSGMQGHFYSNKTCSGRKKPACEADPQCNWSGRSCRVKPYTSSGDVYQGPVNYAGIGGKKKRSSRKGKKRSSRKRSSRKGKKRSSRKRTQRKH